MRRRDFVKLVVSATGAAAISGCGGSSSRANQNNRRVFLVAFDGLDPRIIQSLLDANRLPNIARLAASGSFKPLRTSMPPHTPVAFSNIISGADPGLHQIYDFIHRHPNSPDPDLAVQPYFSTAEAVPPERNWALGLGNWRLPLTSGQTLLMRRGPAFWDYLVENGIDTEVYYVPSNYPAKSPEGPGRFAAITGMGTPDLLGGYGEFTLLTPDVPREGRKVDGGRFSFLSMLTNRGRAELIGPENFLHTPDKNGRAPRMIAPIEVVRDPTAPVAKIAIGTSVVLLNEGEWSDWLAVDFETGVPGSSVLGAAGAPTSVRGMVRLFLKQAHPKLELYISPVNIDPLAPITPISTPADFSRRLAAQNGRFYTAGIPEDTKSLSHGALTEEQFLAQSELAVEERNAQFRSAIANFNAGCLFFYFGATDLVQHMFWRDRDPQHPGRDTAQADRFSKVVEDLYVETDKLVGELLKTARSDDAIVVFSDHGFTTFRRGFNLNTWLAANGFTKLRDPRRQADAELFTNVDWTATTAYGLGLNGLYLNQSGREKHGIVKSDRRRSLLQEIRDKLMTARDAEHDNAQVFDKIELTEDLYPGADPEVAPDLLLGYSDGYRASWATVLGSMPLPLLENNLDRWSGDHSISSRLVPGMLVTNRPVTVDSPSISDLAPTVLSVFGIPQPSQMTGVPLFAIEKPASGA